MSKIYVIEWWVDYEADHEDQNCHEVLNGLGAFDDVHDAWYACIDTAREDSDETIEDNPDAKISDFEANYSNMTVSFNVYDGVWSTVTYKVTEFELHSHSEAIRETQKRVHEATKSKFAQRKAELGL